MTFARSVLFALAAAALALGAGANAAEVVAKPSLAQPSLSPDGKEIAFASGGDIWTVPAAGGTAHLLVSHPATEERPIYSPKGDQLAFTSTRDGAANVYVLTLANGQVRRLTWSDAPEQLDAWSPDGKWLYFSSGAGDVARQADIYRVAASGGTPLAVSAEPYLAEFNAAPSPDGKAIALMARGTANSQWWRNGASHLDETELWLKPIAANGAYKRLVPGGAKHMWPMWAADGASLYFMSDEGGPENIWRLRTGAAAAAPQKVSNLTKGRVLFPSIAADGRSIVFERGFEIWKLDTASGAASAVPITLRGAPASAGRRHLSESKFDEMALSPDGKKVALVAHGQVFAAPAKDGGPAEQISRDVAAAGSMVWSPDSSKLVYAALDGLDSQIVQYDFRTAKARTLTTGHATNASPAYSPDGKMIAYRRNADELRIITLAADGAVAKDVVLYGEMHEAGDAQQPVWSPDSQWVAFVVNDRRSFRNVFVAPAAGGPARPISFLADGQTANQIAWSADGKYLIFDTSQRSEDVRLVRIDLLPHLPKYREDAFTDLFKPDETPGKGPAKPEDKPASEPDTKSPADKEAAGADAVAKADVKSDAKPAKPKVEPVKIVFEGIRQRATTIPLGFSAQVPVISPDGKTLVFRATFNGQQNLYSYDLTELPKEPPTPVQLTSTRSSKRFYAFTPDSKSLYLLDGGVVTTTPLENPKTKPVPVQAELNVDFDQEKMVVFNQAWDNLNRTFFDPKFNGQDWGAIRERWAPYVAGVRTSDELRRDINLMIGELNASHSGINPPAGSAPVRIAELGLKFDREAYEAGRGLVITEVLSLGPSDLTGQIKPGDVLSAVNGKPVGTGVNLSELLLDQAGKRTVLKVATGGAAPREVTVKPVSSSVAGGLRYREWVEGRRAYVEKISNGRLGYVHLIDMSSDALAQLYLDLDSQNQGREGVVVDIRNNNGGFVNGYVLDVFARKNFLLMTPRDFYAIPSRQALGQRALGLPTVLVTNESSLSDAEDFTEGYRALGLGKVVGQPTAGWIIFTSGQPLIDGSVVRLPSTRIQDAKGGDMEMHPRPVDIRVERPLGDTAAGKDAQLDAAAAELLKTLAPVRK